MLDFVLNPNMYRNDKDNFFLVYNVAKEHKPF